MKRLARWLLLVLALAASAAFAAGDKGSPAREHSRAQREHSRDTSPAQRQEMRERFRSPSPADQDALREQFRQRRGAEDTPAGRREPRWRESGISRQEAAERLPRLHRRFDEMDSNRDGVVTGEEMRAFRERRAAGRGDPRD